MSDRSTQVFRRQFDEAYGQMQVFVGKVITLLPLASSAISALSGGIVALTANIANASKSTLGFLGIITSIGVAAGTLVFAFNGIGEAIKAEPGEGLDAILAELGPQTRAAVLGMRSVREEMQAMRGVVQESLFDRLGNSFEQLSFLFLPILERGLVRMAGALNEVISGTLAYIGTGTGLSKINIFLQGNASIMERLGKAVVPFLGGLLGLLNALIPSSERLADRITGLAERFQNWSNAVGFGERIDDMMISAEKSAGLLLEMLKNLGGAFRNILSGALPAGDSFMQTLVDVTERFQDWTGSVEGQNAIAAWVEGAIDSLKALGPLIAAMAKFFTAISDPAVIQGFTEILTSAFETLSDFPLEELSEKLGAFLSAIAPIAGPLLAVAAGMAAVRTIAGVTGAVLGGVVSAGDTLFGVFKGLKTGLGFLTGAGGLAAAGSAPSAAMANFVATTTQASAGLASATGATQGMSGALGLLSGRLGLLLKGAGLVGLAIWIATIIANSEELQEKLKVVFEKLKVVFASLLEAGEKVFEALGPAITALTKLFEVLTPIVEWLVGVIIDGLVFGLEALVPIIEGVANVLTGFINILTGIFTLDGDLILTGLKSLVSGAFKIVEGFFKFLVAIPRAIYTAIFSSLNLSKSALGDAGVAIIRLVFDLANGILNALIALPGQVLGIIGDLASGLGEVLGMMAEDAIGVIGQLAIDILAFLGALPGQLLELGSSIISALKDGIVNGVSAVLGAAADLVLDILGAFTDLPGDLLDIGKEAIGNLLDGIKDGALAIPKALGGIAGDILGFFPGSPVKHGPLTAWNYGGGATGGGRNLVNAIAEGLQDTSPIQTAMSSLAGALTPLGNGVNGGGGGNVTNREMNLVINNPAPERGSDSLTTTARNLAYLGIA
jgi:hypothetical protein